MVRRAERHEVRRVVPPALRTRTAVVDVQKVPRAAIRDDATVAIAREDEAADRGRDLARDAARSLGVHEVRIALGTGLGRRLHADGAEARLTLDGAAFLAAVKN